MLNHASVHHLHMTFLASIWLPWLQVWRVYSLAGDSCEGPTLIQYPLPSVSVPPAGLKLTLSMGMWIVVRCGIRRNHLQVSFLHVWFPPILEWLGQASTASGTLSISKHKSKGPRAGYPSWYWNQGSNSLLWREPCLYTTPIKPLRKPTLNTLTLPKPRSRMVQA